MSEPVHEFLINSPMTLSITATTGALVVLGLLFEIGWHVHQRRKTEPNSSAAEDVEEDTLKRKEGVAMAMLDPKWVSVPISEIKNEMRCFHERMNKLELDVNVMKEAMVTISERFRYRR